MCLILTTLAAIVCSLLYKVNKSFSTAKVLAFMYSCAAIMWTVDCSFAKLKGVDFFDLSFEDFVLGLIVVGFAIFAVTIVKLAKQALKKHKACISFFNLLFLTLFHQDL